MPAIGELYQKQEKPLNLFVYNQMIRFFWHLKNSESDILNQTLDTNLQLSNNEFRSEASYVLQILKVIKCQDFLDESDPAVSHKYLD